MTMGRIRWEYFFIFTAYFMLHNLEFAVFGQDTLEILDFFSEGEVGKNATISCQFAPETGNTTWMFNDVEIKQDKRIITTNQAKDHGVDIDGNKKKYMVSNLTVTNTTSKDDGNYTCIVNWHNKTLERTALLDLSFPGKLVSSTPGPLRKNVTESVELECIFEIYKQSPVKWWSNSEKESILYDPKIINVKQIKSSHKAYIKSTADNGTYHCEVYDSVTDHNITGTIDVLVLDKPTIVIDTVKAIGAHKLFLNWTVNTNNLPLPSYTLKYKTINDSNYRFSPKTIHSNYTSFIMDDLEKVTSYNIVMEVWNSYGKNIYSYPEAVTTLAEDPVFVPNITINGFSATSVTIGWAPPPREIAEYIHYYKLKAQKQNDTAIKETYHPSSNLPYMFDDLEPITTYIFKVQACSEYTKLCGNWSEPNIAMTMDGVPGKPSNVSIQCLDTDGSARQINVTWGPPIKRNAEIKAYSIELTGTASYIDEYGKRQLYKHGPKVIMAMNTSKSTTLREQLMPNTNYTVKVNALTRMRRRGDGEIVQCYTSPAAPDHVPRVRWEKIFDNGYFFKVNLQRESERNGTFCCYRVYMVKMFTREGIKDLPEDPRDLDVISHADAHGYKHVRGAYVTDVFSSKYFPPNGEFIMGDDHSINNATCSRCLQAPRKPTTTEAPTTQDIEDLLAVTEIPLKKKRATEFAIKDNNIDYLDLRVLPDMPINMDIDNIEIRDGKLDPLYNYTMFVELIPANDNDLSIYSKYQDLLMPAPNKTIADNNNVIQIALQVTVGVLALVLLFLIFVCIRHSRRSRKLPHNNVEMNSIQATLSSIYHSLKGGRHQLVATAPPDMPAISKEDLADAYIERQADSDYGFQKEFEMLPDGFPDRTTHASEARENMAKNRYPDIKAYDQTRVKLAQIDSIVGSDYINANYVMGYKERKKFICAQGPTDATVTDFWRMIWEHGLELIVMLTNLEEYSKVKCSRYWPDDVKGTRNFGAITVTHVSEKRYSDYIVRDLKITKQPTNAEGQPIVENNGIAKRNGDPTAVSPSGSSPPSPRASPDRIVRQYHFLMWKDFAAPEHPHSILKFIKRVNCAWSSLMGRPVVVHCSAGVGRTGTLVALDCLLQQLKHEGQVNVFNTVAELRRQRNFLVQSLKQYVFVYRALVEFAHYGDTEIPASKLKSSVDRLRNTPEGADKCLMEVEFEKMLSSPIPEVVKSCAAGAGEELRTKNRSQDCLPYDRNRVILTPMPGRDFSTYINASFIEAYDNSEGYIITQDPLPCTIPDFWRMVSEHNIATIVMLSEMGDGDKKCPRYWDDGTAQYEHISVQYDHSESCPYYTKREFRVTNNKCGTTRTVQQLQYHGWPTVSGQVPEVTRGLAELADAAQTVPLLVHCQLGTERSSMFIALCILIVQLRTERRVDVSCVARKIRYQRHHTLDTFLQYEFLHRAILNYAELHNLLEDS